MYNNDHQQNHEREQLPGIYVSRRQFSWVSATIVMAAIVVFAIGYGVGKRCVGVDAPQPTTDILVEASDICPPEPALELVTAAIDQASQACEKYYIQVTSCGTLHAAHKYAERLQRKNIPVFVKEQHSLTAQGKRIIWYRVVTEPMDTYHEAAILLSKIKKEDNAYDIRILSC